MATKGSRCDEHQIKPWETSRRSEKALPRYQWRKLREKIFKRDQHLCQICLKEGIYTIASECDHITPLAFGGTNAESNLQSVCSACHAKKTIAERRG